MQEVMIITTEYELVNIKPGFDGEVIEEYENVNYHYALNDESDIPEFLFELKQCAELIDYVVATSIGESLEEHIASTFNHLFEEPICHVFVTENTFYFTDLSGWCYSATNDEVLSGTFKPVLVSKGV